MPRPPGLTSNGPVIPGLTDGPGGVAAFGPSEGGVDLAVNQHDLGCTYSATAGGRGAHRHEESGVLADHSPAGNAGRPGGSSQQTASNGQLRCGDRE